MKYFESMPVISYNGRSVRNILTRVALTDDTKASKHLFLPYTQKEHERADVLAHKYYDNSDWAWLVWFSNETVDPYHDHYLSDYDFESMVTKKYGSIDKAIAYVHHWRTNWRTDDVTIMVSDYNGLPQNLKKYFNPVLDNAGKIHSYKRKKKEWTASTNQIITITLQEPIATPFEYGEKVYGSSSDVYGFVTYADETSVTLQHTGGNFAGGMSMTGIESNIQAIAGLVSVVSQNIPIDEYIFWEPVSNYQYEVEVNDSKKQIKLIDNAYKYDVESEVRRVMNV